MQTQREYVADKVPVKGTFFWLGLLLLFVLIAILVARLIYRPELIHIFGRYFGGDTGLFSARQAPANGRARLQIDEITDLANYREKQTKLLSQYSYVERMGQTDIKIPIDVAMKLILEKGLPIRRTVK